MSSFQQDSLVANELRKYITAKDAEKHCWKINAGPHGWGKFFEDNPHLKDTDQKPKKFCETHSTALSWLPDDSAPGKGYITVPEVAVMKPCGASNDPLVVNELRKYHSTRTERCGETLLENQCRTARMGQIL